MLSMIIPSYWGFFFSEHSSSELLWFVILFCSVIYKWCVNNIRYIFIVLRFQDYLYLKKSLLHINKSFHFELVLSLRTHITILITKKLSSHFYSINIIHRWCHRCNVRAVKIADARAQCALTWRYQAHQMIMVILNFSFYRNLFAMNSDR